jgi:uncharacterized protein
MSANSSAKKTSSKKARWGLALLLVLWVLVSYILAQVMTAGLTWLLVQIGVPLGSLGETVINVLLTAIVYVLSLAIALSVPWFLKHRPTDVRTLGLQRLPSWKDIGLAPAGFIVYMVGSVILLAIVSTLVPGFDGEQVQQNGFENIVQRYEYVLAFITLVLVAPVAEEILFRGYLYGKIRSKVPLWAAIVLVSLLFAAVHGQWNVAIDVFALSIVLCILREITGSIWSGILLHMLKNGVAFYFLFLNPLVM